MNTKIMIISILASVAVVTFVGLNIQEVKTETKVLKYADARLSSALELQKGIEVKIVFLLDEITQANIRPNQKDLRQLIQSITTIRAYGKDISKEAKGNLRKIVEILHRSDFKDKRLLNTLDDMAHGSIEVKV